VRRFAWRLQRLLDIKVKQERSLRSELVTLTERAVALRGRILARRAALRRLLDGLSCDEDDWVARRRLVLEQATVTEQLLMTLEQQLETLEKERRKKMHEVLDVRKFRKRLERLRARAYEQFMQEQEKRMQDEIDDRTNVGTARRILSSA